MKRFTSNIKRINLLFLIKAGIGSAMAIWLAGSLGLLYSPSAGIITLLTIQNTKKETLSIALRRVIAFIIAVIISYLIFSSFGYTSVAFGSFVLTFVGFCIALDLKDGISMNAVLMTHFLIEKHMSFDLIMNEVILLLLGMGIGILINFIMPKYKDQIRREQRVVEEEMRHILRHLAKLLRNKDACMLQNNNIDKYSKDIDANTANYSLKINLGETHPSDVKKHRGYIDESIQQLTEDDEHINIDISRLDSLLEELLQKAYEDAGNTLLSNTRYLISYLEMRRLQVDVLKDIMDHIGQIHVILRQSYPIAEFMETTADSFHERNNAIELMEKLEELKVHYKDETLPTTREEFEYRAILYQILKNLEYFLILKRNFVQNFENKEMKSY